MRWFKFHADLINDPTLQRLPGDKFKTWINLLCITSKHDGVLPPLTDLTFLLRPMVEDKIAEQTGVTEMVEVVDEDALAAWDAYGRATKGKAYPRNRRGGWRFPTKWPPGHEAEVRQIGRTA